MSFERYAKKKATDSRIGYAARLRGPSPKFLSLGSKVLPDLTSRHVELLVDPERVAIAIKPAPEPSEDTYLVSKTGQISATGICKDYELGFYFDGRIVPCLREGQLFVFELDDQPEVAP